MLHHFNEYKQSIPVRGAILLNKSMDKVLLIQGAGKRKSWGFPRGKRTKDESDVDCAIREVC